jgi:hypothetical protein
MNRSRRKPALFWCMEKNNTDKYEKKRHFLILRNMRDKIGQI